MPHNLLTNNSIKYQWDFSNKVRIVSIMIIDNHDNYYHFPSKKNTLDMHTLHNSLYTQITSLPNEQYPRHEHFRITNLDSRRTCTFSL